MTLRVPARLLGACIAAVVLAQTGAWAQARATAPAPPASAPPQSPEDALGRGTPRGTVLGFLNAGRKGENELARKYLNTPRPDAAAEELAHQLFVVLDARLPARLTQLSDAPEGSRANPLEPDREVVGSVGGPAGSVDVVLERVKSGKSGPIWLFSSKTVESVAALYPDVVREREGRLLPRLLGWRFGHVRLFEALVVALGVPLFYLLIVGLSRALTPLAALIWRRVFRRAAPPPFDVLPLPARLLLMAVVGRWLASILPLSLLARQGLSNAASLIAIGAGAWLLFLLNGEIERHIARRAPRASTAAAVSLLRVGRRVVDALVIFVALLATLRHFGVDPTPVLAGLGVGGLAVALAAQKTLENVIAGASLIFDQAVRVGDFLRVGEIQGTVDAVGLRSTRIRTLDRTVVSVPNSQIASMSLETLSARDKFWFHPIVGLRYETTGDQLHAVIDGFRHVLETHPAIDEESIRVRFLRLGAFSLDVDVFAYVYARDWNHFLEVQENLLFSVTDVVREAGTAIAFPSQTMYVTPATQSLMRN